MSNTKAIINMAANAAQVSSRTYNIDKLNDKNYELWRMTMEIILQQYNLLTIVVWTSLSQQMHQMCKFGSNVI
jgi:hypothetical protein